MQQEQSQKQADVYREEEIQHGSKEGRTRFSAMHYNEVTILQCNICLLSYLFAIFLICSSFNSLLIRRKLVII
jgi:hypothetical protein